MAKPRRAFVLVLTMALAAAVQAAEPLENAAARGDPLEIKRLVAAGADINQRYGIGRTALMIAARKDRVAAVEALLDAGADIDAQDNNGDTALMLAAVEGNLPSVRLLVNRGANYRLKNESGYTARAQAIRTKDLGVQPVVQFLSQRSLRERDVPAQASTGGHSKEAEAGVAAEIATEPEPVLLDVSAYRLDPAGFGQAASRALTRRGWTLANRTPERLEGHLYKRGVLYKVEIRLMSPRIRIAFVQGYASHRQNWLRNLEKDLRFELAALRPVDP